MTTIAQDYIDLFSNRRKGHMGKYVYMHRPEIYDDVLRDEHYYPFKEEREILLTKSPHIIDSFEDIEEVIEMGPGSRVSMTAKTLPFLKSLSQAFHLSEYKALDFNIKYAQQACDFVKEKFPDVKTKPIVGDFLEPNTFKSLNNFSGKKKLLFGFGQSIFANNIDSNIRIILDNISLLINKGDYLLISLDINKDAKLLEKAYDNPPAYQLLLNAMHYLKNTFNIETFDANAFQQLCYWDEQENAVQLGLEATKDQSLTINNNTFSIKEAQKLNMTYSRRFEVSKVKEILLEKGIKINEIVKEEGNTFVVINAQKI